MEQLMLDRELSTSQEVETLLLAVSVMIIVETSYSALSCLNYYSPTAACSRERVLKYPKTGFPICNH